MAAVKANATPRSLAADHRGARHTMSEQGPALPGTLVDGAWLQAHLDDPRVVIVDIRGYVKTTDLGEGRQHADYLAALDEFDAGHIPGSVFVDWTDDIIDPNHPVKVQIAPPARFAEVMGRLGIGDATGVVAVDHTGGHFATRLWWALRYYGHDDAAVLDGGFDLWQAEGRPVTTDATYPPAAKFTPRARPELRVEAEDVATAIGRDDALIVDARDAGQYTGAVQRGPRGGHIPSAAHLPAKSLVGPDGRWKPAAEQRALIDAAGVAPGRRVIAYCNGGVTATAVLFALHNLGHDAWANYDGSWNEWGERFDLPTREGAEP
jgi:thiosulfate/3-mercaptopyruvate sulfurtransferase